MAPDTRAVDPVALVGRAHECATVDEMLRAAVDRSRGVLLVGGDAGIGKTTLVGYAAWRAAQLGCAVLEGGCLDLSANVPFAPVLEAVGPLFDARPVAGALTSTADQAEQVPEGRMLGVLREMVAAAAAEGPVLLALEDMHWSEPSTRDLALTLAHGSPAGVLLLLTYRADDVHRGHPFRATLTDIARTPGCVRLDLSALDLHELAQLVERRTGERADPAYVRSLMARSEGNPLFAEELIAAGRDGDGVPPVLAQLFLARVDALGRRARDVLRTASVDGSRVDADLLCAVTGLPLDQVEAGLHEAVDANVVVQRARRLEFRHALLRDAVYDDLLPGERSRLHGLYADALRERGEGADGDALSRAARLAHHFHEAGELGSAFEAFMRAGELARPYATEAATVHYERALELWDRVEEPVSLGGMARSDVLGLAAEGYDISDRERAAVLSLEAIAALGPDPDPLLAARAYIGYAGHWNGIGDDPGERAAVEKALQFVEDGSPSFELARALIVKSRLLMRAGRCREALSLAERSLAVARSVGGHGAEGQAKFHTGMASFDCGEIEAGLAALREFLQMELHEPLSEQVEGIFALSFCELLAGRPAQALSSARDGAESARRAGLPSAGYAGEQVEVIALTWTGELEAAASLLGDLIARGLPAGLFRSERLSELRMFDGDFRGALEEEESLLVAIESMGIDVPEPYWVLRQVVLFPALGQTPRAVQCADRYLRDAATGESPIYKAAACLAGYQALVAATMAELDASDCSPWMNTMPWAWLQTARAYRQRLEAGRDPAVWAAAVASWRRIGFAYYAVAESVHLAADLLDVDRREAAVRVITDSWSEARTMGARALVESLEALAHRAHLHLDETSPRRRGRLAALTRREQEVLDLVSTGATNRAIGETLFISEKTVSVHVSNLMAKLGVSHRQQAAAVALEQSEAE
jgi:DNA-binding CsgD family transcriptional regulator